MVKLIVSDIDGTLIPPEGADRKALELFGKSLKKHNISLAYATGRTLKMVDDAISSGLPRPQYIIGLVGTVIYRSLDGDWIKDQNWLNIISRDWGELTRRDVARVLSPVRGITEQGGSYAKFLNEYKESFFLSDTNNAQNILIEVKTLLEDAGLKSNIIYSIDPDGMGLLDIIPKSSGKENAIRCIMNEVGSTNEEVMYAGDSGNDIDALMMGCKGVVVNNARTEFKKEFNGRVKEKGMEEKIYFAHGDYGCDEGNHAYGVIEGAIHHGFIKPKDIK